MAGCAAATSVKPVTEPTSRRQPTRFDRRELAAIFVGGFAGAVARAELATVLPVDPANWPWATFVANVVGAFLLGWVVTRLADRVPPLAYHRPLLTTGFCGTLTTFSTLQLELLRMLDAGRLPLAAAYALASIVGGLLALRVGSALARGLRAVA
jgi:fluoride exporter